MRAGRPTTPRTLDTTNLTVTDRWGNVVEYTLTIEQTGGSGIVVPGRGFLLNNELTDFSAVYSASDPNRIQPGKRPRSSMSPTIVLKDGRPFLALGSPGGSTIITTVLQMLFNRIDRGMTLPEAIAAPRASQRNTASVTAEQSFIDAYGGLLSPFGHTFAAAGAPGTTAAEIGAATGHRVRAEGTAHRRRRARAPRRRRDRRGGPEVGPYARLVFTEARLTSDMVLEYVDLGDPDGVAGGLPTGLAEHGRWRRAAGRRRPASRRTTGVRVSRPGYGASTLTPPSLASVGRQVVELADLLGWSSFGTFGSSGGGPYALATAAAAPDRVTRVVVAAGPGPTEGEATSGERSTAEVAEFADRLLALDADAFQAAMKADAPPNEHYFDDRPTRRRRSSRTSGGPWPRPTASPATTSPGAVRWDIDLVGRDHARRPVLRRGRPDGAVAPRPPAGRPPPERHA